VWSKGGSGVAGVWSVIFVSTIFSFSFLSIFRVESFSSILGRKLAMKSYFTEFLRLFLNLQVSAYAIVRRRLPTIHSEQMSLSFEHFFQYWTINHLFSMAHFCPV
jgi:hypothetical protein